jgi:hypothetical protein
MIAGQGRHCLHGIRLGRDPIHPQMTRSPQNAQARAPASWRGGERRCHAEGEAGDLLRQVCAHVVPTEAAQADSTSRTPPTNMPIATTTLAPNQTQTPGLFVTVIRTPTAAKPDPAEIDTAARSFQPKPRGA